jgi:hypothetical protein
MSMVDDGDDIPSCKSCLAKIDPQSDQKLFYPPSSTDRFTNDVIRPSVLLEVRWPQDYLQFKLRFTENQVSLIDISSNIVLDYVQLDQKIISVDLLTEPSLYYHINYSDQSCQKLSVEPFGLVSESRTKAEYILNIDMLSENHGYYFGLYEIGEFEIINSIVHLLRNFQLHYVDRGWITQENYLLLSLRQKLPDETEQAKYEYFISTFSWERNKKLKKHWEYKTSTSLRTLVQLEEELFIFGFIDGTFEIFSTNQQKPTKSAKLFTGGFSFMCRRIDRIFCSSFKGEVACIALNGDIIWKNTVGESRILNIELIDSRLQLICGKIYFTLNTSNGEIITKQKFSFVLPEYFSSNFIRFKDWLIISGQAHLAHVHKTSEKFIISADDPTIRVLKPHSQGYISGDDEGKIKFWKYGKISLNLRSIIYNSNRKKRNGI